MSAAVVLFLFAAGVRVGRADGGAAAPARGAGASAPSIGGFLTPQGTLDLPALLRSGGEGAVDLSGYQMSLDAARGAVRVTPNGPGSPVGRAPEPDGASRAARAEDWWDGFGSPGVDNRVWAMAVYDGALILGGAFTRAGGIEANRIVRWDGSDWSSLGTGINSDVTCLQVYNGKLIAGGNFNQAGGIPATAVAQWDGTLWSPLGSSLDSPVQALTTYAGELIAGGEFHYSGGTPVAHLARWDGASWTSLGGGTNGAVRGLGTFGTDLLVGGDFDQIGGQLITKLARWDGSAFSPMGTWTWWAPPTRFVTHQDLLYVGTQDRVCQWTGVDWLNLAFPGNGSGRALCVYDGKLLASGWSGSRIYAWDGSTWTTLGSGLGWEQGGALAEYGGKLFVGGYFCRAGNTNVLHVASWDGSSWAGLGGPVGQGVGGRVAALAVYQGDVIAAGNFSVAGGVVVNSIARWDGTSWHPLAEGVTGGEAMVRSLFVYDGSLFAGGAFNIAGTTQSPGLARWDGSSWGAFGPCEGGVIAMTEYQGDLVVAGWFGRIGGVDAARIARWDGSAWHPFGTGIGDCDVRALTVHGDSLIAGGCFTTANGAPGDRVACWNGTSWSPLGAGISGDVHSLADYQGRIVAGGGFDLSNGCHNFAQWDGAAWVPLGTSFFSASVRTLSVINGDLYAGGDFGDIWGGPYARGIARYDGFSWNVVGSGVGPQVWAITQAEDPTGAYLYLGGDITWAGENHLSAGIARWGLGATSSPILTSVLDVPNDQGRQARLHWRRSKYDAPGQPVAITGYAIFRELGQTKADVPATSPVLASDEPVRNDLRMEGWEYVLTVPAFGDTTYYCVAPTMCDSTISGGLCLSGFMIRAMTPSPFEYYDSAPLSGYSLDNLAPATPANLRFQSSAVLAWSETAAADFDYYSVYGSPSPVFDPQTAVLVGYTTTPEMDVAGSQDPYLHVTATDFAGNEGQAAGIQNRTSDVEGGMVLPARFALYPCQPNPTVGPGVIRFDLPQESDLSLRLFDVAGREVVTLAHGRYPAGQHEIHLDPKTLGRLPAGVYLYRLEVGSFSETRKLQVLGR
jgi:hypothetical protein